MKYGLFAKKVRRDNFLLIALILEIQNWKINPKNSRNTFTDLLASSQKKLLFNKNRSTYNGEIQYIKRI